MYSLCRSAIGGNLDKPAARTLGGMELELSLLLATPLHVGNVTMAQDGFHRWCAAVAGIGAQVFRALFRRRRALDLDGLEIHPRRLGFAPTAVLSVDYGQVLNPGVA